MKTSTTPPKEDFESYRSLLRGIAYRMLGSVAEAEDIVQETYLKWHSQDKSEVRSVRAWLVTVCSRLAIDHLKSAQHQRESYIGPWLPEPLLMTDLSPSDQLDVDDSISTALLYTLERLSPSERAAFLLHDIFDYSFDEIAEILGKSSEACRKLASRARMHTHRHKPRFDTDVAAHQRLIDAFFAAVKEGDLEGLKAILAEDVTVVSDGGGKAIAARKIIHGADLVSKFYFNVIKAAWASGNTYEYCRAWYNGAPGLILYENGQPVSAINIHIVNGRIGGIYSHRNPEKLAIFRAVSPSSL